MAKWQYDNYFGGDFHTERNANFSDDVSSVIDTAEPEIGSTTLRLASVSNFPDPSPTGIMQIVINTAGGGDAETAYYKSITVGTKTLNLTAPVTKDHTLGHTVHLKNVVCDVDSTGVLLRLEDDNAVDISALTDSAIEGTIRTDITGGESLFLILRHQNDTDGGDFYALSVESIVTSGRFTAKIYHHDATDHTWTTLKSYVGVVDSEFSVDTLYDVRFQVIGTELKAFFRTAATDAWESTDEIGGAGVMTVTDTTLASGAAGFGRGINTTSTGDLYFDNLVIDDLTA